MKSKGRRSSSGCAAKATQICDGQKAEKQMMMVKQRVLRIQAHHN